MTLLVFLWGLISMLVNPWEPFWIPNLSQVVLCFAGLVYLLRTWRRPRRRLDEGICAILIVYTLLLLPWTAVVWCELGRPMEAFTVPAIAVVTIALVFPGRWSLGIATMGLFAAESLFVFVYARYLGLESLLPVNEPLATYAFAALGVGVLLLRRRRHELARQYVRVQAELKALERIRPTFARAQEELEAQVSTLETEFHAAREETGSRTIARALHRLDALRLELGALVAADEIVSVSPEAERRLLDRDAQLGAMSLAGIGAALAIPAIVLTRLQLGDAPTLMAAMFLVDCLILIYLMSTRGQPSSRRALLAVLALFAAAWPVIVYNQFWLLEWGRPFTPFVGHKLLMGGVGLTSNRFKLGIVLIVATGANAIVLWFMLDLGARMDLITLAEPWVTLVYMLIGLVSLQMLEQRKFASVQLLRAEVEASTMQRRASMFLALRDRLNSPLQTLVLSAAATIAHLPASSAARAQAAIDRLVALSRELAELELGQFMRWRSNDAALDVGRELRRHI